MVSINNDLNWPPLGVNDSKEDYAAYASWYWVWEQDRRSKETQKVTDVEFYLRVARQSGGPVLELGTGSGQLSATISAAGIDVVGLDNSLEMLQLARSRPHASNLRFANGDARHFQLDQKFKLIIFPFTGFGHIVQDDDRQTLGKCVLEHLDRGGMFVLDERSPRNIDSDLSNPSALIRRRKCAWRDVRDNPQARTVLGQIDIPEDASIEVWRNTRWDGKRRIRVGWDMIDVVVHSKPFDSLIARKVLRVFIRVTSPEEMVDFLKRVGFSTVTVLGSFEGRPYDFDNSENNEHVIYIAHK